MSVERLINAEELTTGVAQRGGIAIEDASSWVLRIGVVVSLATMFTGLVAEFVGDHVSIQIMESQTFSDNFGAMLHGVGRFDGFSLMELGVLMLVLTPILRVFTAMVLFAVEERDRLYTAVTFIVLVLTLSSLLFVK